MAKGTVQLCDPVRFSGWTNEQGLLVLTVMEPAARLGPCGTAGELETIAALPD